MAIRQKRVAIANSGTAQGSFPAADILQGRIIAGDVFRSLAGDLSVAAQDRPAKIISAQDLGQLVRQARRARNLSQQDFADLAGIGRRFLSELENGKRTIEFDKALAAAAAAGIDLMASRRG